MDKKQVKQELWAIIELCDDAPEGNSRGDAAGMDAALNDIRNKAYAISRQLDATGSDADAFLGLDVSDDQLSEDGYRWWRHANGRYYADVQPILGHPAVIPKTICSGGVDTLAEAIAACRKHRAERLKPAEPKQQPWVYGYVREITKRDIEGNAVHTITVNSNRANGCLHRVRVQLDPEGESL